MAFGLLWLLLIGLLVGYHFDLLNAEESSSVGLRSGYSSIPAETLDQIEDGQPLFYAPSLSAHPNFLLYNQQRKLGNSYSVGDDDSDDSGESGTDGADELLKILMERGSNNGAGRADEVNVKVNGQERGKYISDPMSLKESDWNKWDKDMRRSFSKGSHYFQHQAGLEDLSRLPAGKENSWLNLGHDGSGTGSHGVRVPGLQAHASIIGGGGNLEGDTTRSGISKRTLVPSSSPSSLWSCTTEYSWTNLGPNHYPQYVRTASCSSTRCFNDFFHCAPVPYNISVLKKLGADEAVDRSSSVQLPPAIRDSVKLINVSVNTFCECRLGRPNQ